MKTHEEIAEFIKKYPHTWKGRNCEICGADRNNEVCLCHAHFKEVTKLNKKHAALAASHRRLVEAVNAYCVVPSGEITSMKLARKEFQTALAEAEELIKKEG